jgi:hypothetical protein
MQQNPEFPELGLDASDFGLDGLIPTAKRGDTDLRLKSDGKMHGPTPPSRKKHPP